MKRFSLLLVLLMFGEVWAGGNLFRKTEGVVPDEPALFVVTDFNDAVELSSQADSNSGDKVLKSRVVVATHGWLEKSLWPRDMAADIRARCDANEWSCCYFDWRGQAKKVNPTDAAQYAKDVAAGMLAESILSNCDKLEHIHLIGHSAGSWLISGAGKILAEKTGASVHLTFLDAYVPFEWQEDGLGFEDVGGGYFAEHYFTKDVTLASTQKVLPGVVNVELTRIEPGVGDHEFPRYWYHGTVLGRYQEGTIYAGKRLYNCDGDICYGFALTRECADYDVEKAGGLEAVDEAVVLKPAEKGLLEKIFEKFKK